MNEIKPEFRKFFEDDNFLEAWTQWRAICRQKKSVDTSRSWNRHLTKLVKLAKDDIKLMAKIIDQSADGGINGAWTSLFAFKEDDQAGASKIELHPDLR